MRTRRIMAAIVLLLTIGLAARAVMMGPVDIDIPDAAPYIPAEFVYVSRSGEKYHRASCNAIVNSVGKTCYTRAAAEEAGYEPCSMCVP